MGNSPSSRSATEPRQGQGQPAGHGAIERCLLRIWTPVYTYRSVPLNSTTRGSIISMVTHWTWSQVNSRRPVTLVVAM